MTTVLPDATGHYGRFGGRFVPEALIAALEQLDQVYRTARKDPAFNAELDHLQRTYTGRPSPLTRASRFAQHAGGADVLLKREDLNHTGSHKINNVLGQALLTKRMGKTRVIAETGAGQHGVATATAAALLGLDCVIYMGEEDTRRQALNVVRMRLLGAEVVPVTTGSRTLKDSINEALRDWVTNVDSTHYLLGTVAGPHPFPVMVRDFHAVIGEEAKAQVAELTGGAPDAVTACVGGGSNAIGIFHAFVPDPAVRLYGCCTARARSCCRTRTARPLSRTPSRPASTTRVWVRSTPGWPRPAGPPTGRSPTPLRWRRSGCCAAPRASSRPSRVRTRWPARWRSVPNWVRAQSCW